MKALTQCNIRCQATTSYPPALTTRVPNGPCEHNSSYYHNKKYYCKTHASAIALELILRENNTKDDYYAFRERNHVFGWGIKHRETNITIGYIGEKGALFGVAAAMNNDYTRARLFLSQPINSEYWSRFK